MTKKEFVTSNNKACRELFDKLVLKYKNFPKIELRTDLELSFVLLTFHDLLHLKISVSALPVRQIEWYINVNNGKTHTHDLKDDIYLAVDEWFKDDIIFETLWGINFRNRTKFVKRARKQRPFRLFYKVYDSRHIYLHKSFGKVLIDKRAEL